MPVAMILLNTILFILLFGGYCILIFNYEEWFKRLKEFEIDPETIPLNSFSIIIPARNEEENIEKCVISILQNNSVILLILPQLFKGDGSFWLFYVL